MNRFKNILCVADRLQPVEPVLERAVSLAENNQAALTVVAVAERVAVVNGLADGALISSDMQKAAIAEAQQHLDNALGAFHSSVAIHSKVLVGTPFLEVIREVLRNGHDLVIAAPEDPNWLDRLFGSDDMHLLRKCPCPVWFIKPSPEKRYRRILAAVDVDADHPAPELAIRHQLNVQILGLAVSLALSDFAELHVAHVWTAIGESSLRGAFLNRPDAEVDAYVEQVRQQHEQGLDELLHDAMHAQGEEAMRYLSPVKHLLKGAARAEIPAIARRLDIDLVVMGTVARTGVPGFFIGNTAEAILNQIECSVLAVKPDGFRTPVTLDA